MGRLWHLELHQRCLHLNNLEMLASSIPFSILESVYSFQFSSPTHSDPLRDPAAASKRGITSLGVRNRLLQYSFFSGSSVGGYVATDMTVRISHSRQSQNYEKNVLLPSYVEKPMRMIQKISASSPVHLSLGLSGHSTRLTHTHLALRPISM